MYANAQDDPTERSFKSLSVPQMVRALDRATPKEKQQFTSMLFSKVARMKADTWSKMTEDDRADLLARLQKLSEESRTPVPSPEEEDEPQDVAEQ